MALSCWARANLRYRIARTLLMEHLKSQRYRTRIQVQEKIGFSIAPLERLYDRRDRPAPLYSPQLPDPPAAFLEFDF
jgi:hypothetical protein